MTTSRIVLVTGASGGLGPAVVRAFQDCGDTVLAVARSSGDFRADLTDPQQVSGLIQSVIAERQRIDVLVNVLGGYAGGNLVQDTEDRTWEQMLAQNLNSAFYLLRAVLPHMLTSRKGHIIAVGSRAGTQAGAKMAAYATSKAALHALVQCAAEEVKGTGVTVNAVLPGVIDTAANRTYMSAEQTAKAVPPASIAATIVWLASASAQDVNGALVPVYGQS